MISLDRVEQLYSKNLENYGPVSRAVGWKDEAGHNLRFAKLAMLLESTEEPLSVNDLGCGYGAFYEYLRSAGFKRLLFRGYDISERMLEEARARMMSKETELVVGSRIDKHADYSFASGIFNVRMEHDADMWKDHIFSVLDNMCEHSKKGFAFNLLTTHVDWQERHLYYGDPALFFVECRRRYSRYVSLLHDYPLWEWTILVRKHR